MKATAMEEYPQNLLDEIANAPYTDSENRVEWEEPLPTDFAQTLAYVLAGLTEREQQVIELRYKKQMSYVQIGRELGVSGERVRQVGVRALRKLCHPSRRSLLIRGIRGWVEDAREAGRQCAMSEAVTQLAAALKTDAGKAKATEVLGGETPIEDAGLSARATNVLLRAGCKTLGDVAEHTESEVMRFRNMGRKSFEEIVAKLAEYGIKLKGK